MSQAFPQIALLLNNPH